MIAKFVYKNVKFVVRSVVVACVGIFFFKWYTSNFNKGDASRKCFHRTKDDLSNLKMHKGFLERRIKSYFSLFCAEGVIEVNDLSKKTHVANCNEKRDPDIGSMNLVAIAFWLGLACLIIALKVLPDKHEDHNRHELFPMLLFVFVVFTVLGLGFLVKRHEIAKVSKVEFERLDSELKREYMQYSTILSCVGTYNGLSSGVRGRIKHSDCLSKVVEEKILSGKLSEDEAKKIERKVMKLSSGSVSVCA